MKVELELCTTCGAKNSRFVEKCYRCGALLPWAPGYTPPIKPAPPAPGSPPPPPPPNSSASHTVTIPPRNGGGASPSTVEPVPEPGGKKPLPTWAKPAGIGAVVLVLLLVSFMLIGRRKPPAPAKPPVSGTPAPGQTPAASPAPGATPAPGTTAAPSATAVPAVSPAPAATGAPAPAAKLGPTLADVEKNLIDPKSTLTSFQKDDYWKGIAGSQVLWEGEVQDVKPNSLQVTCKGASLSFPVEVNLDGTQAALLGSINKKQKVKVQGVLKARTAQGFTLEAGRVFN